MILPDNFILKMKEILSEEFEDYLKSFEESSYCGLRINTLKIYVEDFKSKNLFKLDRFHGVIEDFIMMRI